MDEERIEAAGVKPLQEELDRIAALKDAAGLLPELARLHLLRVPAAFRFGSTADAKDSRRTIGELYQGGLTLPDRDYYLKDDDRSNSLRAAYLAHMQKMFGLLGDKPADAERHARVVSDFETHLAKASRARVDLRDPHLNYHLMSVAEMDQAAGLAWTPYFHGLGLDKPGDVNVAQPDFLKEVGRLVKDVPLDDWKTYLRWHLLNAYADKLSSPFVKEDFHFKGTVLHGTPRNRPRWQRIVERHRPSARRGAGPALRRRGVPAGGQGQGRGTGQERPGHAARAAGDTRLDEPADAQAGAAASSTPCTVKIGYPSKWRDYSGLTVDDDVVRTQRDGGERLPGALRPGARSASRWTGASGT